MRYRLTLLAALGMLITSAARTIRSTPFAGDDAYSTLLRLAPGIQEPYIYTAALALLTAALLLFTYYTQRQDIPEEALLVLAFSPAYLTAAITNHEALLLGSSPARRTKNLGRAGARSSAGLHQPRGSDPRTHLHQR